MLTLARCENAMLDSLGYGAFPSGTSAVEIVNASGQWFMDANSWSWSQRLGFLSTVANQGYVSLAALTGFRKLYRVAYSGDTGAWLEQCDLGYISQLRVGFTGLTGTPRYAAVGTLQDATTGELTRTLELYPTPTDALTDALSIHYTAGWFDISGANVTLGIPPEVEGLFLQVCRAYAHGVLEREAGTTTVRLAQIVQGPEWQAAVLSDGATQINYGQIRGSSIQRGGDITDTWMSGTVPNP